MIAQFLLAALCCVLLLVCVHLMDRPAFTPSRKQRRAWRRERHQLPRTWNKWR